MWRSFPKSRPLLYPLREREVGPKAESKLWSEVADPKGNHASRWVMYEDLAAWLGKHDWSGKEVAEIGGTNGALTYFIGAARYTQLSYPEYDVQNLFQLPDNRFDLIVMDQTLEHVADPERALREIHRVLKPGAVAIITTPFLMPVHPGKNFGDYYRWTPQGMETVLRRCGFEPQVRMWGHLKAAKAILDDMYLRVEQARQLGVSLSYIDCEVEFPVTVWAIAVCHKE